MVSFFFKKKKKKNIFLSFLPIGGFCLEREKFRLFTVLHSFAPRRPRELPGMSICLGLSTKSRLGG